MSFSLQTVRLDRLPWTAVLPDLILSKLYVEQKVSSTPRLKRNQNCHLLAWLGCYGCGEVLNWNYLTKSCSALESARPTMSIANACQRQKRKPLANSVSAKKKLFSRNMKLCLIARPSFQKCPLLVSSSVKNTTGHIAINVGVFSLKNKWQPAPYCLHYKETYFSQRCTRYAQGQNGTNL